MVLSSAVSRSLCPSSSSAASLSSASVVSVLSWSAVMMCPPVERLSVVPSQPEEPDSRPEDTFARPTPERCGASHRA
jgi:hypothetical protein